MTRQPPAIGKHGKVELAHLSRLLVDPPRPVAHVKVHGYLTADELREAAHTLNQFAEYLECTGP